MKITHPTHPHPGEQAGFAIVGVLLLVALMTTLSATYLRHVMVDKQASPSSRWAHDAREASQSGVHFARQVLATNTDISASTVGNGAKAATVAITDLSDQTRASVSVQAVDEYGLGTTLLTEIERIPVAAGSHPDDLPHLTDAKIDEIMNDPTIPKTWLSGTQWIQDTDLEGLVIIENDAGIYFDNVTVKGCIVSEDVLAQQAFGDFGDHTPAAIVDGNLRIDPGDFLPGIAVIMPDGVFRTWDGDESVLLNGDVIANTVMLQGPGAVNGNIAAASPPTLGSQLETPGKDRGPQQWGDGLDLGKTWTTSFMAFLPRYTTAADCSAIINYTFPTN